MIYPIDIGAVTVSATDIPQDECQHQHLRDKVHKGQSQHTYLILKLKMILFNPDVWPFFQPYFLQMHNISNFVTPIYKKKIIIKFHIVQPT